MKLRTRILGLSGLLSLLFMSLIVYALIFFSSASATISRIVEKNLATERYTEILNVTILEIRSNIWDTMVFDLAHRKDQIVHLDNEAVKFYQALRDLREKNPGLEATSIKLRDLFQSYYQFGSTILDLNSLEEFVRLKDTVEKFKANQLELISVLSETVTNTKKEFTDALTELNERFAVTTVLSFSFAGGVLLLSLLLSVLIARRLTVHLEQLTKTAREVSSGNFGVRPRISTGGEIQDLTQAFVLMLDQIQQYSTKMEDLVRVRTAELARANDTILKELKFARKIQGSLIPKLKAGAGPLNIAGTYLPMEDLGGDFFDAFETSPGRWTLVVADVSGHGVPAALVTAMVKISLGTHSTKAVSPSEVLDQVNRELFLTIGEVRQYVTMVYCVLDLNKQRIEYCNAGHNPFFVLRSDGTLEEFGPNSGVVGLLGDEVFFTNTTDFDKGDTILLYTDGVTEARDPQLRFFSEERLKALFESTRGSSPQNVLSSIEDSVTKFMEGQPAMDDITLLAARWENVPSKLSPHGTLSTGEQMNPPEMVHEAERRFRNGDYRELLRWLESIPSSPLRNTELGILRHWSAMAQYKLGQWHAALDSWNHAVNLNPNYRRAVRNRDFLRRFLERQQR